MLALQILLFTSLLMLKCALNRWVEFNSYRVVLCEEPISWLYVQSSLSEGLGLRITDALRVICTISLFVFCESRGIDVWFVFKKHFEYTLNINKLLNKQQNPVAAPK